MLLIYALSVFGLYKLSKSKKYYLHLDENNIITIKYPNVNNTLDLKIHVREIVKIEYYKISSIKSWCMLFNYVCPQCVYITYLSDGIEVCKHIGYPNFKMINEIFYNIGVTIIIK